MINKFFFLIVSLIILSGCGYKPIYSTKNLNFTIGNIEKENTSLNNEFAKSINFIKNSKSNNKIDIKIESNKTVTIKSKDTKGNALIFELKILLNVKKLNDETQQQTFSRKITFKNRDDKFKLKQYEKELEIILINKIVEDLINYFSNFNDI